MTRWSALGCLRVNKTQRSEDGIPTLSSREPRKGNASTLEYWVICRTYEHLRSCEHRDSQMSQVHTKYMDNIAMAGITDYVKIQDSKNFIITVYHTLSSDT